MYFRIISDSIRVNNYVFLFMNLNKSKLRQILSEKFDGIIWKIEMNDKFGLMAIESRIIDLKKTSFTVMNYHTGEVHFKEKIFQEPWNLNLAYIAQKNLIIKGFDQHESLESKGIISVNILNAEILWAHYNLSLNRATDEGLQVYDPRINPRRYSWISHINGESILDSEKVNYPREPVLFPEFIQQSEIPDFLTRAEIIGKPSALSLENHTIICFHEKITNKIQQRLLVYQEDTILLDEILIRDIQKLQPESFFMVNNYLFYIRNKNEIVSYFV